MSDHVSRASEEGRGDESGQGLARGRAWSGDQVRQRDDVDPDATHVADMSALNAMLAGGRRSEERAADIGSDTRSDADPWDEESEPTVIRPLGVPAGDADRPARAAGGATAAGHEEPPGPRPTRALDADAAAFHDQTATQTQLAASGDGNQAEEEAAMAATDPPATASRDEPSLARSSAIMAIGSMVSRVLGLVRQSLLTSVVGVLAAADAFAVANTLPNYVYMLLSAGILNAVLIPQITKAMKRPDGGDEIVNRLVSWSLALVIGVAVVATVATPLLVHFMSSQSGAAYNLTVVLAYVCVPQIAFYGIYAVLGQVLNARNQFAAFMWAPVLANIVQIVGLVWFLVQWGHQPDPANWTYNMAWVLAGSSTLGIVVQGLFLVVPLVRGGYRFRPVFRGLRGSGLGAASRMAGWSFIALIVSMLGGVMVSNVLTAVSNRPGNGNVVGYAGQQYAFMVFMIPHAFITTSVLTALFPRLSRAANDHDDTGMRRLVRQGLTLPATAVIPASIALAVLAIPVVRVMFSFSHPHDGVVVGETLSLMAIGTLPFGITTLQQRYCFAREDGWLNLWMQFVVTGGQVLFLLIALVAPAPHAVLWAAAGQTVGNTVAAVIWLVIANRQVGGLGLRGVVRLWVRLAIASVVAAALAGLAAWGMSLVLHTRIAQVLVLGVAGLLFLAVFWVMAQALHIREVRELVAPLLRRVPGLGSRFAN